MGTILAAWQTWWRRRALATVWRTRVERERSAIGRFNEAVLARLKENVPPKALHDTLVILDELLANVVMHARQAAGPIEVELHYGRRALEARITYLAAEFDPTAWQAAPSGATIAASRVGGLGIQLVRTLTDEFRYSHVDGRNELIVVKRYRR